MKTSEEDFPFNENESSTAEDSFDLDEILPAIGEFGLYQKLLVFGICLPACIPCGFCAFNQLFMADVPDDYWCTIPQLLNFSIEDRKNWSIPLESSGSFSKCLRYQVDWNRILSEEDDMNNFQINTTWPTEYCHDGWEYVQGEVQSSIIIDFDLVCDKDIYPTIGLAALNIGGPIGVYLFGLLNDRAGRRLSYFSCLSTLLFGSFITALSTDFWVWASSRVIVGLTIPAVYQIPFIIGLELVGPNYRSFVTVMTCTFYTCGLILLSGITYMIRDWVELALYTSVPFLSYYLYALVMPESPRWLLMTGKLEEALKVLQVMARVNGRQFPSAFKEKLEAQVRIDKTREKKKAQTHGAFDLCKTPNMRLKTLLITLNWFANETVYLGLSYYGPSLGSNQYLSFLLSCVVEFPSYLCCWFMMDHWGRRWPMCMSMILGGISCIITVLLPNDAENETLVLFLISKSLLSASFLIMYPFAGELYPTQVRGVGIGFSSYIGGLGLIVIPFITYLGKENLRLPLVIMGWLSVFGGFTALRLPETLHTRLPQTLEEGEMFGKDWSFQDCFQCAPITKKPSSNRSSYENLNSFIESDIMTAELTSQIQNSPSKKSRVNFAPSTSFETEVRRTSMKKLVRQQSVMNTQKTSDGALQLTYWF